MREDSPVRTTTRESEVALYEGGAAIRLAPRRVLSQIPKDGGRWQGAMYYRPRNAGAALAQAAHGSLLEVSPGGAEENPAFADPSGKGAGLRCDAACWQDIGGM